ncbi:hypothetical protein [Dechloromonas denitrificans]|uniref:hypothetical protein n=1 Tax=Dechloromonas denitrificans TaxID=281362 RepID=UPI001CF85CF5|nr:hypothetical protein [Dechloromonas denitrificans]UCV03585.1 hypothetical protein KI611_21425 [Dechloromonas denitrificans]
MSVNLISSTSFNSSLPAGARTTAAQAAGGDFLASLQSCLADFMSQTMSTLMSSAASGAGAPGASDLAALLGNGSASNGLSASGRNTLLFDPESAYRMMTAINTKDVTYKAELSEMSDMKSYLTTLQQEAANLATIDSTTGNAEIEQRLQAFADAYNGWINRFDDDLEAGGLLAGTQAATVSQWELEQSVENFFNGAKDGLHGMGDLGLTIDPVTNLASLDSKRLNAVMASNKTGVISTIDEFSANFAKSAELLNSPGNFIPNRLDNLTRVIDYIDDHKAALQAEFGLGDVARPTGQVAKALASYNAIHASSAGRS